MFHNRRSGPLRICKNDEHRPSPLISAEWDAYIYPYHSVPKAAPSC